MTITDAPSLRLSATDVAEIVRDMWERTAEPVSLVGDVVVHLPRLNRVEFVLGNESEVRAASAVIDQLLVSGMEVSVLLPVWELGHAHELLRGKSVHLQGWIDRGDGTPRFVARELA